VGADEEPHDHFALALADSTVIVCDAHGPDILVRGQLLEFQTAVAWIGFEKPVSTAGRVPGFVSEGVKNDAGNER
jgi:hypothetical protein